jgi:hypothetical protein
MDLVIQVYSDLIIKIKEEADDNRQPHFFDNPKTNLTYEKNLNILGFKYHAKS